MEKLLVKKIWILSMIITVGLSLIWLIPDKGTFRESRLISELPERLAGRIGVSLEISALERGTLAPDTTFSRKRYFDESLDPDIYIDLSVVFSGKDINNSIHRPEICLKAQGWNFESERYVVIDSGNKSIPYKEIVCSRPRVESDDIAYKNSKGEVIVDRIVQYYTFAGAEKLTAGHYERTWEDIKMRVFQGTDQQWAYLTISMVVTDSLGGEELIAKHYNSLNLAETKSRLKKFSSDTMYKLIRD